MIPSRLVFEEHAGDYDTWFDEHNHVYQAQLRILRRAVPDFQRGLEVGVGSGRFAVPLGIHHGIDPSQNLAMMAKHRGVEVARGEAEHLPYRAGSFDFVLMMTVICFLDDYPAGFSGDISCARTRGDIRCRVHRSGRGNISKIPARADKRAVLTVRNIPDV